MFAADLVRPGLSGLPVGGCGISAGQAAPRAAGATASGRPELAVPSAATPAPVDVDAILQAKLAGLGAVNELLAGLGAGGAGSAAGEGTAAGAAVAADATLRERTTLRFLTQQGDVVELQLRARSELHLSAAGAVAADGAASAASARVVSGSSLEIHVRGDLNAEELAAIGDVLGKVEALAAQFHSGDVASAFAAAADLDIDGAQLASVALDMRQSLRLRAVATTVSVASQGPAPPESMPRGSAQLRPARQACATAGGYLAGAADQLDGAGAVLRLGLHQKLQLLLQATAQLAPPGDRAVGKLAEGARALG